MINITGRSDNSFLNRNINFQQHPIRMGFNFDPNLGYSKENVWLAVLRVLNASFTNDERTYSSLEEFYENGTDVIPKLVVQNKLSLFNLYPMYSDYMVIVVPESLPYPEFTAYIRTAMSDKFFGYFLIVIVTVILLLSFFRYIKRKKFLFVQSAVDVVNLLMSDNGAIKYPLLNRLEGFLIVPFTFVGLIFVNGILSTLQSHLTQPFLQPQINTLEEVYRYIITAS